MVSPALMDHPGQAIMNQIPAYRTMGSHRSLQKKMEHYGLVQGVWGVVQDMVMVYPYSMVLTGHIIWIHARCISAQLLLMVIIKNG